MTPDPALAAVKTYRYLRVALVALVVLLFAAVALEWWATGRSCLQGSISAYFHTPVQSVFVGTLVAMGVCLVALKGNTETEDALLNVAGMLAPGVAFVPTTDVGTCRSVPFVAADVLARVGNNMEALFVAGALLGVAVAVLARRDAAPRGLRPVEVWGLVGTAVLLAAGAVFFVVARDTFVAHAHGLAAVPMFLAVVAVVWLNSRDVKASVQAGAAPARNAAFVPVYRAISGAMLVALVVAVSASLAVGSSSLVLWVEVVLITLFAVFWVVQTVELWDRGLRRPTPEPTP